MSSPTLLAAASLLIVIGIYQLYNVWIRSKALSHVPTHEFEYGDNSRNRYIHHLKELLESGYRKYSKKGQTFKIRVPIGGYRIKHRVILPLDHLDEIKHLSHTAFSWKLASHIIFAGNYTGECSNFSLQWATRIYCHSCQALQNADPGVARL